MNEYLSKKSSQNFVRYLSCQVIKRTAYLNVYYGRVLKGLRLWLKIMALTTSLLNYVYYCSFRSISGLVLLSV